MTELRSTSSSSVSYRNLLDFSQDVSITDYNAERTSSKLDALYAELLKLDILAFSKIWLSKFISPDELFYNLIKTEL
ncbi:hypothetical protein CHS0354_024345 [Potamilus streckersoni]|uniref:Uncharacterized protein n=1 Tax=Potamilus streckersoni TaxID=2493646 RepID=A0AAE0WD84_9BIVA|nr:hypothetical protein CHS0354_024345 [Potamilus streckersoni]